MMKNEAMMNKKSGIDEMILDSCFFLLKDQLYEKDFLSLIQNQEMKEFILEAHEYFSDLFVKINDRCKLSEPVLKAMLDVYKDADLQNLEGSRKAIMISLMKIGEISKGSNESKELISEILSRTLQNVFDLRLKLERSEHSIENLKNEIACEREKKRLQIERLKRKIRSLQSPKLENEQLQSTLGKRKADEKLDPDIEVIEKIQVQEKTAPAESNTNGGNATMMKTYVDKSIKVLEKRIRSQFYFEKHGYKFSKKFAPEGIFEFLNRDKTVKKISPDKRYGVVCQSLPFQTSNSLKFSFRIDYTFESNIFAGLTLKKDTEEKSMNLEGGCYLQNSYMFNMKTGKLHNPWNKTRKRAVKKIIINKIKAQDTVTVILETASKTIDLLLNGKSLIENGPLEISMKSEKLRRLCPCFDLINEEDQVTIVE